MSKEKRIPTILGLVILIGGVFATVIATNRNTSFNSKASNECKPKNPQVTNITDSSATISFVTDFLCPSTLSINNQIIENLAIANVDQKSKIHYFDVSNLNASTEYSFTLIVDGKNYEESVYKFKTAPKPNTPIPSSNLAWGRVFTPDLKAAQKVIVFVNIPGASPLSALVTSLGNWNISLANSFNESKESRFSPNLNIAEEIIVIDQENQTTQVNGNTSNNDPAPDIILGKNEFSPVKIIYDTKTDTGSLSSVKPVSDSKELDILNPKNNESIPALKPDFFGTAPNNSTVKIEVHSSTVYTGEVVAGGDGSWNWSPPSNLEPGEHTITATIIVNGIEKVVTRKFTVLAADNLLSYSSSPSATTPTPTQVITSTPTASTKTPTVTPTKTSTPTKTPTSTKAPTITPVATIHVSSPSTDSGVPTTGNYIPTIVLLTTAIFFIGFFFFSL